MTSDLSTINRSGVVVHFPHGHLRGRSASSSTSHRAVSTTRASTRSACSSRRTPSSPVVLDADLQDSDGISLQTFEVLLRISRAEWGRITMSELAGRRVADHRRGHPPGRPAREGRPGRSVCRVRATAASSTCSSPSWVSRPCRRRWPITSTASTDGWRHASRRGTPRRSTGCSTSCAGPRTDPDSHPSSVLCCQRGGFRDAGNTERTVAGRRGRSGAMREPLWTPSVDRVAAERGRGVRRVGRPAGRHRRAAPVVRRSPGGVLGRGVGAPGAVGPPGRAVDGG